MSLIGVLSSVGGLVKIKYGWESAKIDDFIFKLHYRMTSASLFIGCLLISANSLIGDPISCIQTSELPDHVVDTYCWIQSTFSMPSQYNKKIGSQIAYPGVGPDNGEQDRVTHAYYQWVPFMLFFQGCLFYFPHWLWKTWEEGRLNALTEGLRGLHASAESREERADKHKRLANYILDTFHLHSCYASGFVMALLMNLANVIGNIFFVDKFLGHAFLKYGTDVVRWAQMDQENRTDPMIMVFPRVTKCLFHKFGPSGSIQRHDIMCVLALNILNEKLFIFYWFWFVILSALTGLITIYWCVIIFYKPIRLFTIQRCTQVSRPLDLEQFLRKTDLGDFFLLYMLGRNMEPKVFRELLEELIIRVQMAGGMPTENDNNIHHGIALPGMVYGKPPLELQPLGTRPKLSDV